MSLHELSVDTIDRQPQPLGAYRGKVVLVVNTASECGYTPQYAGLEKLCESTRIGAWWSWASLERLRRAGAGHRGGIKSFCSTNYQVTFPLFDKVATKGAGAIAGLQVPHRQARPPKWNFHKYLVGKDGQVLRAFATRSRPTKELRDAIEAALAAPA